MNSSSLRLNLPTYHHNTFYSGLPRQAAFYAVMCRLQETVQVHAGFIKSGRIGPRRHVRESATSIIADFTSNDTSDHHTPSSPLVPLDAGRVSQALSSGREMRYTSHWTETPTLDFLCSCSEPQKMQGTLRWPHGARRDESGILLCSSDARRPNLFS